MDGLIKSDRTYWRIFALDWKDIFECLCLLGSHWTCDSMFFTYIRVINWERYWNSINDSMDNSLPCCDVFVCNQSGNVSDYFWEYITCLNEFFFLIRCTNEGHCSLIKSLTEALTEKVSFPLIIIFPLHSFLRELEYEIFK